MRSVRTGAGVAGTPDPSREALWRLRTAMHEPFELLSYPHHNLMFGSPLRATLLEIVSASSDSSQRTVDSARVLHRAAAA